MVLLSNKTAQDSLKARMQCSVVIARLTAVQSLLLARVVLPVRLGSVSMLRCVEGSLISANFIVTNQIVVR